MRIASLASMMYEDGYTIAGYALEGAPALDGMCGA